MQLIVRKYGNLLDVSPDGRLPTPQPVVALLAPELTYTYREILRGADAYDPVTGHRNRVRIETRQLWQISNDGKFTCGMGHLSRIDRVLRGAGYVPHFVDISAPPARPRRYEVCWSNLHNYVSFRPRQEVCVGNIVSSYGGIIKAPTGFGKTTMLAAIALLFPYAKIHVVIRSVEVAKRAFRSLTRFLPDVGFVGDGKKRWNRVTVITADSLHHSDGDADFLFGDECHQLVADSYAEPLSYLYRNSRNYGFSATPYGRNDGAQARLECLFGPTIFEMSYQEAVALGLVVPIRVHWLPMDMGYNPCDGKRSDVTRKRWGLWRNDFRNNRFAEYVQTTYPASTQVLYLVESIEHAVHLKQFAQDCELVYGESMKPDDLRGYITAGLLPQDHPEMNSQRRDYLRDAFESGRLKRAIATDVWATGVDFTALQVVVRCDARESEILDSQGPGRTSRLHTFEDGSEKAYGEVIDAIDNFDKALRTGSRGRFRNYDANGWEQDWPRGRRQISQG